MMQRTTQKEIGTEVTSRLNALENSFPPEILNNTFKKIINKVLYARLREMEIEGASDRQMYSEVFKYVDPSEIPEVFKYVDPSEIPAFPGGLKYVKRGAFCFRFVANEKYYRSPSFRVFPVQDVDQALRELHLRYNDLPYEEYKKARLQEIEGLPKGFHTIKSICALPGQSGRCESRTR